jgi:hypothetical protein
MRKSSGHCHGRGAVTVQGVAVSIKSSCRVGRAKGGERRRRKRRGGKRRERMGQQRLGGRVLVEANEAAQGATGRDVEEAAG